MRLLLATLSHETNTFSPVPTKLERFCRDGTALLSGQTAIDFFRGTGTCMGGYLAVADEAGAEVVVPVCASAPPSGPVDSDAYETMCRMITDAVAKGGFDALWLDLHGAMVTDRFDDGEGELLRRIRAIDPKTPICVAPGGLRTAQVPYVANIDLPDYGDSILPDQAAKRALVSSLLLGRPARPGAVAPQVPLGPGAH